MEGVDNDVGSLISDVNEFSSVVWPWYTSCICPPLLELLEVKLGMNDEPLKIRLPRSHPPHELPEDCGSGVPNGRVEGVGLVGGG